ncbi:hypothetical protein UFOVP807_27 [uncultured Caudovirales phage]|uniref:Uncharacterized protein n=1 Tax=uncultured Caudovirales phage TaxID=2100421 RepID=A0A6J5LWP5_9CAUD|nr:hypothetical protein UFOVP339_14 [uncultured Caudovirales phage]CAB4163578.1 hypothetical protein UFOVP807_27 [uncultured Caudovirales phage]
MKTETPIQQFINQLKAERPEVKMDLTPANSDGEPGSIPAVVDVSPLQLAANMPANGDDWRFIQLDEKVYYKEGPVLIRVWPKLRSDMSLLYSIVSARSAAHMSELLMDKAYAEGKQMRATRSN